MSDPYITRTNGPSGPGTNFSMIKTVILVNTSGYSLSNPSIKIVDTRNGTDFSMVYPIIIVNTSGVSPV